MGEVIAVGKKHILVVDDSAVNLKAAGRALKENQDYVPVLVPSGERALKYLSQHTAELILLDIMMPGMSGFEVLEKLRENEAARDIPVIFLTADDDEDTRLRAEAAGIREIVRKPFQKESLLAAAARHLAQRGAYGD